MFSLAEWREYRRVISKPMDFGTIMKKYKNHQYITFREFLEDNRLVFSNAFKFNKDKDNKQIIEAANRLRIKFETEVAKYEGKPLVIPDMMFNSHGSSSNRKSNTSNSIITGISGSLSTMTNSTSKRKLSEKEKEILKKRKTCEECYNKIYNHEYIKMTGFGIPHYISVSNIYLYLLFSLFIFFIILIFRND